MKILSFIFMVAIGIHFTSNEPIVVPIPEYRIIDNRLYEPINQCIRRVKEKDDTKLYNSFSISFSPPHVDTVEIYEIINGAVSDTATVEIRTTDYITMLIQGRKDVLFSDSTVVVVYDGYDLFIKNPPTGLFESINENKTCKFASRLMSIDDRYMWRYKYDPELGFEEIIPPLMQWDSLDD